MRKVEKSKKIERMKRGQVGVWDSILVHPQINFIMVFHVDLLVWTWKVRISRFKLLRFASVLLELELWFLSLSEKLLVRSNLSAEEVLCLFADLLKNFNPLKLWDIFFVIFFIPIALLMFIISNFSLKLLKLIRITFLSLEINQFVA